MTGEEVPDRQCAAACCPLKQMFHLPPPYRNNSRGGDLFMQKKEPKHTRLRDNTTPTRELYSQLVHTYRPN